MQIQFLFFSTSQSIAKGKYKICLCTFEIRRKRCWAQATRYFVFLFDTLLSPQAFPHHATINAHILSIETFPSFSNLIIYLYFFFQSLLSMIDVISFCANSAMYEKFSTLLWEIFFFHSSIHLRSFYSSISCICFQSPSKIARETCNDR